MPFPFVFPFVLGLCKSVAYNKKKNEKKNDDGCQEGEKIIICFIVFWTVRMEIWFWCFFYSTPPLDASDFPVVIFNTLINMHILVWCQLRMILTHICRETVILWFLLV